MPTTITNSTTATLIAVITWLTREDSLVPNASSRHSTTTTSTAPQSKATPPSDTTVDMPTPASPATCCRYADQPLASTPAARANSSTRSQPMIHATSSPN